MVAVAVPLRNKLQTAVEALEAVVQPAVETSQAAQALSQQLEDDQSAIELIREHFMEVMSSPWSLI